MSKEIKTRKIRKDIKVLDKVATGTEHVKRAYVRTKEQTEETREPTAETPVEDAENQIAAGAERSVFGVVHQVRMQGGRMQRQRAKGKVSADTFNQPKEQLQRAGQELAKKKRVSAGKLQNATIKTIESGEKTIKTVGSKWKQTGKGTVKTASRTIKSTKQTVHNTAKTSQTATVQAKWLAQTTAKTAEKTAMAARQAARTAVQTAKATARATLAAVRAIIAGTKALVTALLAGGWIAVLILLVVVLFGGILCVTGGGNSNTVSAVSAEVEAYEPLIRQYATQYGIGEYVELIKAIMMQESGGLGLDPMQSSEGAFNTRFPRQPNGITDPAYSIECGVQEIKACLVSAEVETPVDMERIKLALQGYNYGNGYIPWAKEKDGGYTPANAIEFSDMMAEKLGWSSYGDKQYVSHVLRYYPFGRIPTGTGSQAIVQVALSQEGNGGETYWSWYGFDSRVEWCACFASWCADQCGYIESGVVPKFAKCDVGVNWFQSNGQFQDGNYTPAAGDFIFFDWGNDGSIDHVGIVESTVDGVVHTVEGNSSDAVNRRSYSIGSAEIYGYGVPAY